LINQREIFNKRIASVDASNYYLIYKNEFAYNKSYSIGYDFGAIKRLERYEKGIVSSLYICFGLKNPNADGDFYKQYFDSNFLNQGISEIAQEGARNHGLLNIAVGDFLDLDIPLPPLEEQIRIAEVLTTLDTELEGLRGQLERIKMQKKV
jgi:type I restriction enzyme, S subunit